MTESHPRPDRDGAAPPLEPELTRFGATFVDREQERSFVRRRFERELRVPIAVSAWASLLIYAAFYPIDALVVPEALSVAGWLRFAFVVPIAAVLALITISPWAERLHRVVGVIHALIGPILFLSIGAVAGTTGGALYSAYAVLFPLLVPQIVRLDVRLTAATLGFTFAAFVAIESQVGAQELTTQLFLAVLFMVGGGFTLWVSYSSELAARRADWQERLIAWQVEELQSERAKAERLLLNVLPSSVADRLRDGKETIADSFDEVTVLFADLAGFTEYSSRVSAAELVERLDAIFSRFDEVAVELGLEKIKTIGDAYMVAGGLPQPHADAAGASAEMALAMRDALESERGRDGYTFGVRIGIHTGPAVAGVIGRSKFIYDLWGDTVNTAARMESHGAIGRIQITEATRERLGDRYEIEPRGAVDVKGKGEMTTFWLVGRRGDTA